MTALAVIKISAVTLIVGGILSLTSLPGMLASRAIDSVSHSFNQALGLEAR